MFEWIIQIYRPGLPTPLPLQLMKMQIMHQLKISSGLTLKRSRLVPSLSHRSEDTSVKFKYRSSMQRHCIILQCTDLQCIPYIVWIINGRIFNATSLYVSSFNVRICNVCHTLYGFSMYGSSMQRHCIILQCTDLQCMDPQCTDLKSSTYTELIVCFMHCQTYYFSRRYSTSEHKVV